MLEIDSKIRMKRELTNRIGLAAELFKLDTRLYTDKIFDKSHMERTVKYLKICWICIWK